jgi:hypothetical protein
VLIPQYILIKMIPPDILFAFCVFNEPTWARNCDPRCRIFLIWIEDIFVCFEDLFTKDLLCSAIVRFARQRRRHDFSEYAACSPPICQCEIRIKINARKRYFADLAQLFRQRRRRLRTFEIQVSGHDFMEINPDS